MTGAGRRILVTRPAEDAEPLIRCLADRGYEAIPEPMLTMRWLDGPEPELDGVQALLFTSANGVRAYARRTSRRDRPAYAVGDATAAAARAAGFARVESAAGDVYALASLVAARCAPDAGPLLHVAGTVVAGDLAGALVAAGFTVRREALYEAVAATALGPESVRALSEGGVGGALFFSPRTARSFVRLLAEAGLDDHLRTVEALCLSPAVAEAARTLDGSRVMPWKDVRAAARPEQDALLALLPDHRDGE